MKTPETPRVEIRDGDVPAGEAAEVAVLETEVVEVAVDQVAEVVATVGIVLTVPAQAEAEPSAGHAPVPGDRVRLTGRFIQPQELRRLLGVAHRSLSSSPASQPPNPEEIWNSDGEPIENPVL